MSACNPPCAAGNTCSDHGECVASSAATAAATTSPDNNGAASSDRVLVELESDHPNAVLMGRHSGAVIVAAAGENRGVAAGAVATSRAICTPPCGATVDSHGVFWVTGKRMKSSATFVLPEGNPAKLRVRAGSSVAWGFGVAGVIMGIATAVAGGAFLTIAATKDDSSNDDQRRALFISGGSALGGGLILGLVGSLLIANNRTTVWQGDSRVAVGSGGIRF